MRLNFAFVSGFTGDLGQDSNSSFHFYQLINYCNLITNLKFFMTPHWVRGNITIVIWWHRVLKVQYWSGKIINESNKIVKPRLFSASSFKRLVLLKKLLWTPCGPKQFCQKPFSSFCLLQWWLLRTVCLITEHCHLHGLTLTNQQKKKVGCNSPFVFT